MKQKVESQGKEGGREMMSCWVKMQEELGFGWRRRVVEEEWRKGPWSGDEDKLLTHYVQLHGQGRWNCVARLTGLKRNGKSCRLRWVNYLRPDLKRSQITPHEETIILDLHARWGNRWSTIARSLPGRTDNEIKNYWRTHFKNKSTPRQLPPHRRSSRNKNQQQMPTNTTTNDLILNNIPQIQDNDDTTWDIGSLWENLQLQQQEIDHPNSYAN